MPNKTKVKVNRWVDTPDLARYETYVTRWHYFLDAVEKKLPGMEEEQARNANLLILKLFFLKEYEPEDFYGQFETRMQIAEEAFE